MGIVRTRRVTKFGVGELVQIKKIYNSKWNNTGKMDHWDNTYQVVEEVVYDGNMFRYYFKGDPEGKELYHREEHINSWMWEADMMVSVEGKVQLKRKLNLKIWKS